MKITASEIQPNTHVWVGTDLVYVESVQVTMTGRISINSGDRLMAADMLVTKAF